MRRETGRGPLFTPHGACPSLCIFSSTRTPSRIRRRAALSAIEAHYQAKEAAAAASERPADLYVEAFSAPSPRPTPASGPATGYEGSEDGGEVALFGGKVRGPAMRKITTHFIYCALLTICMHRSSRRVTGSGCSACLPLAARLRGLAAHGTQAADPSRGWCRPSRVGASRAVSGGLSIGYRSRSIENLTVQTIKSGRITRGEWTFRL